MEQQNQFSHKREQGMAQRLELVVWLDPPPTRAHDGLVLSRLDIGAWSYVNQNRMCPIEEMQVSLMLQGSIDVCGKKRDVSSSSPPSLFPPPL